MKYLLPALLALAGCDRQAARNEAVSDPPAGRTAVEAAAPAAPARLAGLYEGGTGAQKSQMCIVEKGGDARFGLLVWGANLHSCSGAGKAVRKGERLILTMTGDESCTIEASLGNGVVTLPDKLPLGCAYYCGARASFAGARFSRSGDDVKKATDIAGDPLCD